MSQHDMNVANDTFPNVRSDLNNALAALASENSGGSAPSTTFAYQFWADTTNGIMKRRNAANSAWVIGDTLAESFYAAKSSNYTVLISDHQRAFVCTSTFTLSLTAAATLGDGHAFFVRNAGTGIITIDPNSTEQIDGATTVKLYPGESCMVLCSGSAFVTVGRGTGEVLMQTQTASTSSSIDFTGLDNTFSRYRIELLNVKPSTDDVNFAVRVGTGGTPTWVTSGYKYGGKTTYPGGGADHGSTLDGATDRILISDVAGGGAGVGNASGENLCGQVLFDNPANTDFCEIRCDIGYSAAGSNPVRYIGNGRYDTAGAITALRFLFSSGNIASGEFRLYGLRG